jgi:hypothetical protein
MISNQTTSQKTRYQFSFVVIIEFKQFLIEVPHLTYGLALMQVKNMYPSEQIFSNIQNTAY